MYPVSSIQPSKRKSALQSTKKTPKVNEAQSKDIMNQLFEDLDKNEVEDLEERNVTGASREQVYNESGQVAFSKQEEMQFKETTPAALQAGSVP